MSKHSHKFSHIDIICNCIFSMNHLMTKIIPIACLFVIFFCYKLKPKLFELELSHRQLSNPTLCSLLSLNLWPLFLFFLATFSFSQPIELFHSVNSIIHTFYSELIVSPATLFSFITSCLPLLFFTHGLNALPHLYLRPDLFDLWLYAFSFPVYSSFSPARRHYCRLENRRTHITFFALMYQFPKAITSRSCLPLHRHRW